MFKKILTIIPFALVFVVMLVNSRGLIFENYSATPKFYISLIVVIANAITYFIKYKFSILFTGVVLVLATFDLLTFYMKSVTWSFSFTPEIQVWSLLMLVFYCAVNFNQLIGWYLDAKGYKEGE